MTRTTMFSMGALLGVTGLCAPALGQGEIIQPVSASTSYVELFSGSGVVAGNLVDQSGLSAPYTSGVTDFDTFVAAEDGAGSSNFDHLLANSNGQNQPNGVVDPGGTITLDLGSEIAIDALAFWSETGNEAITAFNLHADDDDDFTNGGTTLLGSYSPAATVDGQAFSFDAVSTRYVHMEVTGHGGGNWIRANEMAVRAATPSSKPILQPTDVTSSYNTGFSPFGLGNVFDQSGLSSPYVSGVTDFNAYIASVIGGGGNSAHVLANSNGQNQPNGIVDLGGTFTIDLGAPTPIDALGFWNREGNEAISAFSLYADDDNDFTNGTTASLGSYVPLLIRAGQTMAFTPTITRYLHIEVTGHGGGNWIRLNELAVRMAGDECECAIPVGNETVLGNLNDNSGSTGDDSSCAFNDNIDEWYCYTALSDGTLTVTTCNPGSDIDTVLSAFDACGGVEIICNDDTVGSPIECVLEGLNRLSTISFAVVEKTTYYIRVSPFNDDLDFTGSGTGAYEITFAGPTVSTGDECPDAVAIGEECIVRDLSLNTGSTGDDSSCAFNDTIDEWLVYTASADGRIRITTCKPGTEFDTTLSVFDDCPENSGAEIICNDDTVGAPAACDLSGLNRKSTVEIDVINGDQYFIRVGVFNDDFTQQGAFGTNYEIGITLLCPCDWNGDGNLNDQDFFDWANDYFSQTGPQGNFDFNGDGNQNDQDWFDFVNCFFNPPPQCLN